MDDFPTRLRQKRTETADQQSKAALLEATQNIPERTAAELATLLTGNDPRLVDAATHLVELIQAIQEAAGGINGSGLALLPDIHERFVTAVENIPERVAATDKSPTLVPYLKQLVQAVRSQELNPTIQVAAPDITALEQAVSSIEEALKNPAKLDTETIEKKLDTMTKAIRELVRKPMPVPTIPHSGAIVTRKYDYVGAAYPDATTEVYTFKTGGASGSNVAVVTVVYTDSTKENINSVTAA